MVFETKEYLDYPGLQNYDGRLKKWVLSLNTSSTANLQAAIDALEEKVGDENVDERIAVAVASIIDSAPETLDTLKEVADWIAEHGEAASALIQRISELEAETETLDKKIDEVYNALQPITGTEIAALFLEGVAYDNTKTLIEQIAALGKDEKLIIDASSNPIITEDVTITNDCVIEAQGVEFTGTITVDNTISATIIGATFSGEVKVQ